MRKTFKNSKTPFFITELADVSGGRGRSGPTHIISHEDGRGTTRMDGEEGDTGGGMRE